VDPPPEIENTSPRDTEHLVTGEHREIAVQSRHVDRDVAHALVPLEYSVAWLTCAVADSWTW
jgi:hypothetical protein